MKNAATFLSLISAGVLTLSVAYDFGYLLRFGVSFSQAPTTLSDHIRSSLVWVPGALFVVFILFAIRWSFRRQGSGEAVKKMPGPPKYLYLAMFSVPAIHFFVTPAPLLLWTVPVSVGWYFLHERIFRNLEMHAKVAQKLYLPVFAIPPILMIVAAWGYHKASFLTTSADNEHVFTINGKDREFVLARHFEKYFLVWDKDKSRVEFISTASVSAFHPVSKEKSNNEAGEEMPKGVEK